jgi:hypothetical protein
MISSKEGWWMKRLAVVLLVVVLGVALLCLGASEKLTNRSGATASGVVIQFSEEVRITSCDKSTFPTQSPASGESESFTFSGGTLDAGGTFRVTWSPTSARVRSTKWITSGLPAVAATESLPAIPTTYEEIMAQIAHYPGPDEPLYVPAEGEQIWLTDLEGHADIYDNDSIKINYAPRFDKSQITKIEVYRNGIKMRFLPDKLDVLTNEQMKTFDGDFLENTPQSNHTDHVIWGYEYQLRLYDASKTVLGRPAAVIRSPVHFAGEALAFVGHNFFDWLDQTDAVILQVLASFKQVGFSGVQVDVNYYMTSPTASEVVPQYKVDLTVCETWQRTGTQSQVERMLRLARTAGMTAELRLQVNVARKAQPTDPRWRGAIAPRDVSAWFSNYGMLCKELAALAEREGAKRFGLGVELNSLEHYTERWRELADSLRNVFHGELTFAQCTAVYLAGYNTYNGEARFERNVGTFWNALDLVEVNMWPGAGGSMVLEVQRDQRFSVLLENLVRFWAPAFRYYRSQYPALPVCFGELGTFDYDGAVTTDDFYGAWRLPGAKLDHQEYVDTWAAYLCMATALDADGLAAWTVALAPSTPQSVGTHQLNMTPAIRTLGAILSVGTTAAP